MLTENVDKAIVVWDYDDAPEEYRRLSEHGGDEDWLAFIPERLKDRYIPWLEDGSSFGCCSVSEHPIDGGVIKIGAHA